MVSSSAERPTKLIRTHRRCESQKVQAKKIELDLRRSLSFTNVMKRLSSIRNSVHAENDMMEVDDDMPLINLNHQKPAVRGILKTNQTNNKNTGEKVFRFNEVVYVGEALSGDVYERKSDFQLSLTPELAYMIKRELNEFKANEMPIHEESKQNTHFFKV